MNEKIFIKIKKKKIVVCDDNINLNNFYDELIIWWKRAKKVETKIVKKEWSNED